MLTTAHIQQYRSWMGGWMEALGSTWGKVVNPGAGFVLPGVPNSLVRIWTDNVDAGYIAGGRQGGRDFVRAMWPRWQQCPGTCYSLWNEPDVNTNVGLANLNEATIGAVEEAAALGIMVCVGEWPEGNPHDNGLGDERVTAWKLAQLRPSLKVAADAGMPFGRHIYWRPGVEGPTGRWHALGRLKWDLEELDIPGLRVLVTEYGIDGGIAGGPTRVGWQRLTDPQTYRQALVEAERYARTIPGVESLMLFGVGATDVWLEGGFDVPEDFAWSLVDPLARLGQEPVFTQPTPQGGILLPIVNSHKAWYSADSLFGPYDGHPARARDWNLEAGGNSDLGEPLQFPCDGTVVYAGNAGRGHGNVVSFVTVLKGVLWNLHWKHLQRLDVKQWAQVKQGQIVGTVGNADGYYAGAHVHEEAVRGAITGPTQDWRDPAFEYVDPAEWYKAHGVDAALVDRMTGYDGR